MQQVHVLPAGLPLVEELTYRYQIVQAYYQAGDL